LLAVFAQLQGASLTCVGVGPELATLKASASKNVTFLGSVDNAEIKSLCLTHDFLILPSLKSHGVWLSKKHFILDCL
jgi:glycosyltransferase involved in cell wall biosynthesis